MKTIIDPTKMTEEDIKHQFITPAIEDKWDKTLITMETKITDGAINIKGNKTVRQSPKRADYLLYIDFSNPIAVVEAKDYNHLISSGMQQAITYAEMLDLPFAYSSNGQGFQKHGFLTGHERTLQMKEFPSMKELKERYKKEKGMTDKEVQVNENPYYSSADTYSPRNYQRIAATL